MSTRVTLLLVEDNPGDSDLAIEELSRLPDCDVEIEVAVTIADAVVLLDSRPYDGLVLDLNLPDSTGKETLEVAAKAAGRVPIVVFSGRANEAAFVRELRALGATDVISKNEPPLRMVGRSLLSMFERVKAEHLQRDFEALVSSMPEAVFVTDPGNLVLFVNRAATELFRQPPEEFLGEPLAFSVEKGRVSALDVYAGGERRNCEVRIVDCVWASKPANLVTIRDITEQKLLGEQLRQSQKMEALGLLAGGVAHDLNNLLLVMLFNTDTIRRHVANDHIAAEISEILRAVERAQDLTQQLLTFSRKQPISLVPSDMGTVLGDLHQMLRRILPANIEISTLFDEDIWPVLIDRSQMEQVILNLAINARDAMPDGGKFTIELQNTLLPGNKSLPAGEYVACRVTDSGEGIAPAHLERIFEPFFTTKQPGLGTGLGLATSYAIISQFNGEITVESTLHHGTAFTIILPRCFEMPQRRSDANEEFETGYGRETILVVEDDPAVSRATSRLLEERGYVVMRAANGDEARRVLERENGHIDLVLSDIVMPQLGGAELADALRRAHDDLPVIFMTGYSDLQIEQRGSSNTIQGRRTLMKPFRPTELLQAVRDVLDSR